jgi:hypothetical protein
MGAELRTPVPYPTPYLQGLFPSLCADLAQLKGLVNLSSMTEGVLHRERIATIAALLSSHDEALALFLAHPTRRLSDLLLTAVTQAQEALTWLKKHPPALPFAIESDSRYVAIGERMRRGISAWRLSIELQCVCHDLDEAPVEAVH